MKRVFLSQLLVLAAAAVLPTLSVADEAAVYAFDQQGAPIEIAVSLFSNSDESATLAFGGTVPNTAATFFVALPSDWDEPRAEMRSAAPLRTLLRVSEPSFYSVSPADVCVPETALQTDAEPTEGEATSGDQAPVAQDAESAVDGWAVSRVTTEGSGLSQLRLQQPQSINSDEQGAIFERHSGQQLIVASAPDAASDAAMVLELPTGTIPDTLGFDGTAGMTLLVVSDRRYDASDSPNVMAPSGLTVRNSNLEEYSAEAIEVSFRELAAGAHPDPVITTFASQTSTCSRCEDAPFDDVATGLKFAEPPPSPELEGLRFVELVNTAGRGNLDDARLAASMAFVSDEQILGCADDSDGGSPPGSPDALISFTISPEGHVSGAQVNGVVAFDDECLADALNAAPLTRPSGGNVVVASRWRLEFAEVAERPTFATMGERTLTRLDVPATAFSERIISLRAAEATTGGLPPASYGQQARRGAWLSAENRFESVYYFVDEAVSGGACEEGHIREARLTRIEPDADASEIETIESATLVAMLIQPTDDNVVPDDGGEGDESEGDDEGGATSGSAITDDATRAEDETRGESADEAASDDGTETLTDDPISTATPDTSSADESDEHAATDSDQATDGYIGGSSEPLMHVPHSGEPTKGCATTGRSGAPPVVLAVFALLMFRLRRSRSKWRATPMRPQ